MSHDYEYLRWSIPAVYEHADSITLAVDKDCRTWHGKEFSISDDFFDWLKAFDVQSKIKIYRDDFYVSSLLPLENDTRERNMLAEFMGRDEGWHIQVDADEVFVDFKSFVDSLSKVEKSRFLLEQTLMICADYVGLLKSLPSGGILQEKEKGWYFPVATNRPYYSAVRNIDSSIEIKTQSRILHLWYGRTREEVIKKIANTGHNHKKDKFYQCPELYMKLWDFLDEQTCPFFKALHPAFFDSGFKLSYCKYGDVHELIDLCKQSTKEADDGFGKLSGKKALVAKIWKKISRFLKKPKSKKIRQELRKAGF